MIEEERVRKEIAMKLNDVISELLPNIPVRHKLKECTQTEQLFLKAHADQILSIKGIRIESDDQSLPELNLPTLTGNRSLEIAMASFAKKIRNDVLDADFVKCLPKKE